MLRMYTAVMSKGSVTEPCCGCVCVGGEAIGAVRLSSVAVYAPSVRCGLAPGLWGRVAGSATEIMAIGSCLKCTESAASEPLRSS